MLCPVALVIVIGCAGCGRIGFGASADDVTGPRDASMADASADEMPDAARPIDLIPGLVAWYPLDDAAFAGSAFDASGGGRAALCQAGATCPAPATGRVGGAASFAGLQWLRIPHDAGLNTTAGFTVSAWFNVGSTTQNSTMFCKPVGSGTNNTWQLEVPGSPDVRLKVGDGSGSFQELRAPIAAGTWYHAAGTWDGTTLRLYVDGALAGSSSHPQVPWDTSDLLIGADENTGVPAGQLDGRVDEVRLYDRALTVAEIVLIATP